MPCRPQSSCHPERGRGTPIRARVEWTLCFVSPHSFSSQRWLAAALHRPVFSWAMKMILQAVTCVLLLVSAPTPAQTLPKPTEGEYVVNNFHFGSGEVLPRLRLHYAIYGKPARDANGRVTNAVLVLHGTTGSGQQFTGERFAGVLFGPGQLLDITRYYVILPDSIGHGHSSKPSDGLHARFPHYDYDDMVQAQYLLLTEGLKVNHLRLVMGTSMGCMHTWIWTEAHPDYMDAAMPLACLPVQIAGRNR